MDVVMIKQAARGRWPEILSALGGIPAEVLDGQHHPCPKCGGKDRFRMIDTDAGALFCNRCFAEGNGDGIAALEWLTGEPFKSVVATLGAYLGIQNRNGKARGPTPAKRSKRQPRIYATSKSIVAGIIRRLTKDHGPGVAFVKAWDYGEFQVLRFDLPTPAGEKQRKTFRPVHQMPLGTEDTMVWTEGYPPGPGKKRPVYRRKEIEAAQADNVVTIHGGEKAADAAAGLGLLATTNAGGEKAMEHTDWSPVLRFRTVAIVVDNDPAGEAFGLIMAAKLRRLKSGADVRIVKLPDLPPKGDVVEWIAAGGTRNRFLEIRESTQPVTAKEIEQWGKKTPSKNPEQVEQVSNAIVEWEEDEGGEKKAVITPRPMTEIVNLVSERTAGQLRRVDNAIFSHVVGGAIDWLLSPAALFGFLQTWCGIIDWRKGPQFVTKEELLAYPTRAIVVEATWPDLEQGEWRSQITASAAIGSVLGWIAAAVPIILAGDYERAGRHVSRLLFTAARRRWREAGGASTCRGHGRR